MKTKKILGLMLAGVMVMSSFVACGGNGEESEAPDLGGISVVSREDGSGTRGAFIELFGVEEKQADGTKVDNTTIDAEIANSTSIVLSTVAGNPNAIGYISLGSMNDTVKALKIDGAEATVDNIKSGTYKIYRPFNIATKAEISPITQDFINFILSTDGQAVVEDKGYISAVDGQPYASANLAGKVTVAGSSSVTPVMEALKEAYIAINPNVTIEVQQSDSTTGMTSTIEGICDIGMASRELKDSELEKGISPTVIALDGIAVIINNENTNEELPPETVKAIFTGEITDWTEI